MHRFFLFATSVVVAGLYLAACVTPAVTVDQSGPDHSRMFFGSTLGFVSLLLGWFPPYCIPWSANWFLFIGWGCLLAGRFTMAAWLSGIGTALALTTWACPSLHLLTGYYFWHSSMLILAIAATVLAVTRSGAKSIPETEQRI